MGAMVEIMEWVGAAVRMVEGQEELKPAAMPLVEVVEVVAAPV
jgi:hypothetical protein